MVPEALVAEQCPLLVGGRPPHLQTVAPSHEFHCPVVHHDVAGRLVVAAVAVNDEGEGDGLLIVYLEGIRVGHAPRWDPSRARDLPRRAVFVDIRVDARETADLLLDVEHPVDIARRRLLDRRGSFVFVLGHFFRNLYSRINQSIVVPTALAADTSSVRREPPALTLRPA